MDTAIIPLVAILLVCLITQSVQVDEDVGTLTCINCAGDVGGAYTSCGETIDPGVELETINCTGSCMKQVQYFIDQKISVERNCTEECNEGCTMILGTSTCVQCCQEDRCNDAVTWSSVWTLLNVVIGAALVMAV